MATLATMATIPRPSTGTTLVYYASGDAVPGGLTVEAGGAATALAPTIPAGLWFAIVPRELKCPVRGGTGNCLTSTPRGRCEIVGCKTPQSTKLTKKTAAKSSI